MDAKQMFNVFDKTYGRTANIENIYHEAISKICYEIQEVFPGLFNRLTTMNDDVTPEQAIGSEGSCTLTIYGDDMPLMTLLRPVKGRFSELSGYFVIQGVERIILSYEISYTACLLAKKPPVNMSTKIQEICEMRLVDKQGIYKSIDVFLHDGDIRLYVSTMHEAFKTTSVKDIRKKNVSLYYAIHTLNPNLGFKDIKDMLIDVNEHIANYATKPMGIESIVFSDLENMFETSFVNTMSIVLHDCDSNFIATTRGNIDNIILRDCFPDLEINQRIMMLMLMASAVIDKRRGITPEFDENSMVNKRIDTYPFMFERFVSYELRRLRRDIEDISNETEKSKKKKRMEIPANELALRAKIISEIKKIGYDLMENTRKGVVKSFYRPFESDVVQTLSRRSYIDAVTHLRKVKVPYNANVPDAEVRKLREDHFGFFCPFETPESKEVGLVKYLALSSLITGYIKQPIITAADLDNSPDSKNLFLNSMYIGRALPEIRTKIRRLRFLNNNFRFISCTVFTDSIYIFSDIGRLVRPLVCKETDIFNFTDEEICFLRNNDLVVSSPDGPLELIEYLDQTEIRDSTTVIGFSKYDEDITHYEIHPVTMFGFATSLMPFPTHNHAPRLTFQAGMTKQAMSTDPMDLSGYTDDSRFLPHGQRDICSTITSSFLQHGEGNQEFVYDRVSGHNVVIAVMAGGYNQEDSLIFNAGAIKRGLFRNVKMRRQKFSLSRTTETLITPNFEDIPSEERFLDDGTELEYLGKRKYINRLPQIGSLLDKKDPIAVKFASRKQSSPSRVQIDNIFRKQMRVQNIEYVYNNVLKQNCHVNVVAYHIYEPSVGDKFASRYSQKGVIGAIFDEDKMPYTSDGVIPDVIINPHAIPSRMTLGHLIESLVGKYAAQRPDLIMRYDSTISNETPVKDIYSKYCDDCTLKADEMLYDPIEGVGIGEAFVGVCYYTALKHQVDEKMFCRGKGAINAITRQPTEGKAKGGGLRIGEMERDALIVHGVKHILESLFKKESDEVTINVCSNSDCGEMYVGDKQCERCGSPSVEVSVAHSINLVIRYIEAANVKTTATVEPEA